MLHTPSSTRSRPEALAVWMMMAGGTNQRTPCQPGGVGRSPSRETLTPLNLPEAERPQRCRIRGKQGTPTHQADTRSERNGP